MDPSCCGIERLVARGSGQIGALRNDDRAAQEAMNAANRILLVVGRQEHRHRAPSLGDRHPGHRTRAEPIEDLQAMRLNSAAPMVCSVSTIVPYS